MPSPLSYKIKQFFFVLIKLSIVVSAFYFIYVKLNTNIPVLKHQLLSTLTQNRTWSFRLALIVVSLSLLNWYFEIIKWKILVKPLKTLSFSAALEQSLSGLSASLITPNRLGDFGVKALYYTKSHRKAIISCNALSHLAQLVITVLMGSIGLIQTVKTYNITINYNNLLGFSILITVFLILVVIAIKYKRLIIKNCDTSRGITTRKHPPLKTLIATLLLALLRYLIFSFQFFTLLRIFGSNLNYKDSMILITSMYLLASIIPSFAIVDLAVKGSIAVVLFNFAGINELTTLSAVLLMWILNFAIPSIFGCYYILNFKYLSPRHD